MKILPLFCLAAITTVAGTNGLNFERNLGQTSTEYSFVAKARGQTIFVAEDHSLIELHGKDRSVSAVRMKFVGANTDAHWTSEGLPTSTISYFIGKDESRWVRAAPQYARLIRQSLYPGIDLVLYGNEGRLEYDLVLAPGADPSQIRLRFDSEWDAEVDSDSAIEVHTTAGTLKQKLPVVYQQGGAVQGRFVKASKNEFRLALGDYDHSATLVVDPVIDAASYVGGELDDQVVVVGYDYIAGNTASVDFQSTLTGKRGRHIFLQTFGYLNVYSGTITSAYLVFGGSGDDELTSASPRLGNFYTYSSSAAQIYLAGSTSSSDLPFTSNSFQGGATDGFILQFAMQGSFPRQSITLQAFYFGGSGDDRIEDIFSNGSGEYVTGSTTSTDLPVKNPMQASLAGGKDAFVAEILFSNYYAASIFYCTYLGGSGDDTGRAISAANGSGVFVGGDTTSLDFPLMGTNAGSRKGPSDAFFAKFAFDNTSGGLSPVFSRLIGGSGDDSIRAFGITSGNPPYLYPSNSSLAIAGVTNSTDFPVVAPAQSKLGGGTDAFVMSYGYVKDQITFSTYLGGSGDDFATAAAIDQDAEILIAGNTKSSDFPLKIPVQSSPGGGQDAFLATFSTGGEFDFSSYYGGSADEEVRSVLPLAGGSIRIAGGTTSVDLPGVAPGLTKDGGSDGFTADLGIPVFIVADTLTMPKGGILFESVSVAQAAVPPITVRSLNPAKLLLSTNGGVDLVDQITLTSSPLTPLSLSFALVAMDDNGQAQIELSAAGFATKRITVNLFPAILYPSPLAGTYTIASKPTTLYVSYCALEPGLTIPRYCSDPLANLSYTWVSSNPEVASITTIYGQTTLNFLKRGAANVSLLAALPVVPPNPGLVTVTGNTPTVPSQVLLGKDMSYQLEFRYQQPYFHSTVPVTVRSSDPSLVVVSSNPDTAGDQQLQVFSQSSVSIQALADHGQATITLSSTDFDADVQTTVELHPTYLEIIGGLPSKTSAGSLSIVPVRLSFDGFDPASSGQYYYRPGAPQIPFRINSSDPTVLPPVSFEYSGQIYAATQFFQVIPKTPGTTVLTGESAAIEVRGSLSLEVTPAVPPSLGLPAQVIVGKDLQNAILFNFLPDSTKKFTVTVADPSLALVSSTFVDPGASQFTTNGNYQSIYVQGLAESGTTTITVSAVDGSISGTVKIVLAPSGMGFSLRQAVYAYNDGGPLVAIQGFALDDSGFPIAAMSVRPGVSAAIVITATSGTSASILPASFQVSTANTNGNLTYEIRNVGATHFTMSTPDGFRPVPRRAQFDLSVVNSTLNLPSLRAAQGGVISAQFPGSQNNAAIHLTSSDPAKLLLSSSMDGSGAAASIIAVRGKPFYLVGLASSGTVTLHASGTGYPPVDSTVTLGPLSAQLAFNADKDGNFALLAGSQPSSVQLNLIGPSGTSLQSLAPGTTLQFGIANSDRSVADTDKSTVSFSGSSLSQAIQVAAKSPGTTKLTIQPPAGVSFYGPSSINVTVSLAKVIFSLSSANAPITINKDLIQPLALTFDPNSTPIDNVIVTVTSLNPEKVLVSRTPDAVGTASTTILYPLGYSSQTPVAYLQALDSSGTADIQLSAPGFAGSTTTLVLKPLMFSWGSYQTVPQVRVNDNSVFTLFIVSSTSNPSGVYQPSQLRPGLASFTIPTRTDPPNSASFNPPQLTFVPSGSVTTAVTPTVAGTFDLVADLPDGTEARQTVQALPGQIGAAFGFGAADLGKDMSVPLTLSLPAAGRVTISSTDASSLLVSADETQTGSSTATIDVPGNQPVNVYLQALAGGNRNVTLNLDAPGFESNSLKLTLLDSGFSVVYNQGLAPSGATQLSNTGQIVVTPYIVNNGNLTRPGKLRPGVAPITISAGSSSPTVVSVEPASTKFGGLDDIAKMFTVKAGSTGTSIVTLSGPSGYALIGPTSILFSVK